MNKNNIKLLVSDVDGTLLTPEKVITPETIAAVARLKKAGIRFTLISGRSPDGLPTLISQLGVTELVGAFNGAQLVWPNLSTLEFCTLPATAAEKAIALCREFSIDYWLYGFSRWLVSNPTGPYINHESNTVGRPPDGIWPDTKPGQDGALPPDLIKIVGVSDQPATLAECEAAMQHRLGGELSASRSQAHYLDITRLGADKGHGLRRLATVMGVPLEHVAAIGDGFNDLPMLQAVGLAMAMGNGADALKKMAQHVTAGNADNGFAKAVDWLLGPAK